MNMFLKWWLLFVVVALGLVILQFFGVYHNIYVNDWSRITFIIMAVGLYSTIHTGYFAYKQNETGIEYNHFWADICITLGFLGTVIGMIDMMSAFTTLNLQDQAANERLAKTIGTGMATALYTTLAGLAAYVILKLQCFLLIKDEEKQIP